MSRRSDRLQNKQEFKMPSRDEIWSKIPTIKTKNVFSANTGPSTSMAVRNFTRENHCYNTDNVSLFSGDSKEPFDDFVVNDNESISEHNSTASESEIEDDKTDSDSNDSSCLKQKSLLQKNNIESQYNTPNWSQDSADTTDIYPPKKPGKRQMICSDSEEDSNDSNSNRRRKRPLRRLCLPDSNEERVSISVVSTSESELSEEEVDNLDSVSEGEDNYNKEMKSFDRLEGQRRRKELESERKFSALKLAREKKTAGQADRQLL